MKKLNVILTMGLLALSTNVWAGGGTLPNPNRDPGDSFRKPVSRPEACINTLPYVAYLTCVRTSDLAAPFNLVPADRRIISSKVVFTRAQWIQNPNNFDRSKCLIAGQSGYRIDYEIAEMDSVSQSPVSSKAFAGMTTENRIAFQAYNFLGTGSVVKDSGGLISVLSGDPYEDSVFAGSVLSLQGNRLMFSGKAYSYQVGLHGQVSNLEFVCTQN